MERRQRPWHPFRQPGMCGLRGTLCCLVGITVIIVVPILWAHPSKGVLQNTTIHNNTALLHRTKRHLTSDPYGSGRAPEWLLKNLWMQYVNYTARTTTNSSCLICQGYTANLSLVSLPGNPHCRTEPKPGVGPFVVCLVDCLLTRISTQPHWRYSHSLFKSCPPLPRFSVPSPPLPVAGQVKVAPGASFICFNRTYGSVNVGRTRLKCAKTHTLYPPDSSGQSTEKDKELIEDGSYGRRWKRDAFDYKIEPYPDIYWNCGRMLKSLPANWTGVCAITMFASQVHLWPVGEYHHSQKYRVKRLSNPLGSFDKTVYVDAIGVPRGVPDEFKARNQIAAGFESAFCWWCTLNKNLDWINYIYYNQQRFINYTHDALTGLAEQMSATSLMSWQNRMALDMLLADRGGVCVMFGDSCCTFIPNNTAPDGSVTHALKGLRSLRGELAENSGINSTFGWFDTMFGKWKALILSLLTGIIVALTLMGLCGCCIIPCIRGLIVRAIDRSISTSTGMASLGPLPYAEDKSLDLFPHPGWSPPYPDSDDEDM